MLLEFKMRNYKSFVDEMVFSMTPAPKQKGLDYSILNVPVGNKNYRGLSSAVIYGPNASGKTNIIGAMDVRMPTEFSIRFVDQGLLVDYSVKADIGSFLDVDYKRKIIEEKLSINEKLVFLRNEELIVELPSVIKAYVNKSIKRKTPKMLELAKDSLSDTELFLNNGFKSIYAQELVKKILDWVDRKFIVVYRSDDLRIVRKLADPKANTIYVERTLTEAAKAFGITGNALGYKLIGDKEGEEAVLYSVLDGNKAIPAEVFESYGTIRFVNEFPLVIYALLNGGTLIMDEFDASIHPMALMNIINIFHNDDVNRNGAQLVFNTHNPIFLSSDLLRRDEIKFVERDEKTGYSEHYALSDFRTADGIRKGEDYMNNYFVSRYGAIKEVDFSQILEKIIAGSEVYADA